MKAQSFGQRKGPPRFSVDNTRDELLAGFAGIFAGQRRSIAGFDDGASAELPLWREIGHWPAEPKHSSWGPRRRDPVAEGEGPNGCGL